MAAKVARSLMTSLVKRYGKERGEMIYMRMMGEGKGPFRKGGKYRAQRKDWLSDMKKPPSRG